MASPQKGDGYTDIANDIMDHLCKLRIPGEARQVLDLIFRKTYGFSKKTDKISLSQFVEKTGLSKPHVCKALSTLSEMKLIITQKGNDMNTYSFNKDYDQWQPLPKKVTLPKKVMTVTEKGNCPTPESLPLKGHTTPITTPTITTPIREASPQQIFRETWKKVYGKYPTGGRTLVDFPINRLINAYGLDKICNAIIWAEQARPKNQYIAVIRNPKDLEDKWNSLVNQRQKELCKPAGGKNYDE
jgi:phage replication O-like protein O